MKWWQWVAIALVEFWVPVVVMILWLVIVIYFWG